MEFNPRAVAESAQARRCEEQADVVHPRDEATFEALLCMPLDDSGPGLLGCARNDTVKGLAAAVRLGWIPTQSDLGTRRLGPVRLDGHTRPRQSILSQVRLTRENRPSTIRAVPHWSTPGSSEPQNVRLAQLHGLTV